MTSPLEHAYAVILAGGRGERFWPLSTAERPKQFISLFGGRPLLSLAVDRLDGVMPPERVYIVTARDLLDATRAACPGVPAANIVGEPCRRDTAAACAVACGLAAREDPEAIVCILTADQLMADIETFRQALRDSVAVAGAGGRIVTIGIPPTGPATGFGYIEAGETLETNTVTLFHRALRFVEKPDRDTAARYVAGGRHYWNAGMFIWRVATMRGALARFAPALDALAAAVAAAPRPELDAVLEARYRGLDRISIDYAVMEHADNIAMARGAFGWDDVGAWPSVAGHFAPDTRRNVVIGPCELLDASDNIVISENRLTALIGVHDLVVVHSANATLICPRERAQEVKLLLERIERRPDGAQYL